jgi:hypothetical protein
MGQIWAGLSSPLAGKKRQLVPIPAVGDMLFYAHKGFLACLVLKQRPLPLACQNPFGLLSVATTINLSCCLGADCLLLLQVQPCVRVPGLHGAWSSRVHCGACLHRGAVWVPG